MRELFSSPATMRSTARGEIRPSPMRLAAAPRRQHRRLVARLARSAPVKPGVSAAIVLQLHVRRQLQPLQVDAQDIDAPLLVRPVHQHLAVEPPGPQQRRVEDLRPVGRRQDDDRHRAVEPVHLRQQLVERLLLLVLPAHRDGAAGPAQRVQLVDEDDARRRLARLLEQVAHAGGADADEHLDELGAVGGEERHARLAGHRAGQQRLAGARRADQQDAARDVRAQPGELVRPLQEIDDLVQFVLRLVDAGDVVERAS